MSNYSSFDSIYVRELDSYISLDWLNYHSEQEEERREWERQREEKEQEELIAKLESLGTIKLFAEVSLSYVTLSEHGISPEHWQWGIYQAERRLRHYISWDRLESLLVRELHSLGRAYAIRRYAKFERLSVAAAMTAVLPHGISALLHQYFMSEDLQATHALNDRLNAVLREGLANPNATAYSKTARVQAEIHAIAADAWGDAEAMTLNRKRMREMLSLTRLHFAAAETKSGGLGRLDQLKVMYDAERERLCRDGPTVLHPFARFIRNWHLQHVWPLTTYYPISIRHAFDRGSRHEISGRSAEREVIANELALAYCSTSQIERIARERGPRKKPRRIKP